MTSTTKPLSRTATRNVLFTQYSTAWKVLAESEEREFTQEHQLSLWGYLKGLSFALHVVAVDHSACSAHPLAQKLEALDQVQSPKGTYEVPEHQRCNLEDM